MDKLLPKFRQDFPDITFRIGSVFSWSPKDKVITYVERTTDDKAIWSIIHEISHAQLHHTTYTYDIELLQLEVAAWQYAVPLAQSYGYTIDNDHIQDCLDTYREWLHKRSTCPTCTVHSLQKTSDSYSCFNCGATWKVTHTNFCRPYRRLMTTTY